MSCRLYTINNSFLKVKSFFRISVGRNAFEEITTIRNRVRNLKSYLSTQQLRDVNKVKQLIEECEQALSKFRYELKKSTQSLIHDEVALWQECSVFEDKVKGWKQGPDSAKPKNSNSDAGIAVTLDLNLPSQVCTYQHFLASTGGRTGGWTEFDHSTFLRIRRRILRSHPAAGFRKHSDRTGHGGNVDALLAGDTAESFFDEVAAVLPSKTPEMVKEHEHWWISFQKFEADNKAAVEYWKAQKNSEKVEVTPAAASSGATTSPKKLNDQGSAQIHFRERQRAKVEAWRANKRRELEEKREAEVALQRARYEAEEQKRQARMNSLRAKLEDFVKRREQIVASRAEYRAVHERAGRAARRELCALISARIQERNERILRTRSANRTSQKTADSGRQQRIEHAQSMLIVSPSRDPSRLLSPTKSWKAHVDISSVGVNITGVGLSALSCRRAIPTWRAGLNS
uniref:Coiled-coil domain-containing protein 112 n=2 Tax=Schistocephalus solidus TaxID=70667 RepID=A0A0X3PUU3_SCHSO